MKKLLLSSFLTLTSCSSSKSEPAAAEKAGADAPKPAESADQDSMAGNVPETKPSPSEAQIPILEAPAATPLSKEASSSIAGQEKVEVPAAPKPLWVQTCTNADSEPLKFSTRVEAYADSSRRYSVSYAGHIDDYSLLIRNYKDAHQNPQVDIVAPKSLAGAAADGDVNPSTVSYVYVVRWSGALTAHSVVTPILYSSTQKVVQKPELGFELPQQPGRDAILFPSLRCEFKEAS